MDAKKRDRSYIQCLNCGNIYTVERKIPIGNAIVNTICPKCSHKRGLNCGQSEDDIAELKDSFLDERYFIY